MYNGRRLVAYETMVLGWSSGGSPRLCLVQASGHLSSVSARSSMLERCMCARSPSFGALMRCTLQSLRKRLDMRLRAATAPAERFAAARQLFVEPCHGDAAGGLFEDWE